MPPSFDLVLREETLANEQRTVLTPDQVADLTAQGFSVALVRWPDRVFSEQDYISAVQRSGAPENFGVIAPEDWKTNPEFQSSIVLGTKKIAEEAVGSPEYFLTQTHIHFDHSYKGQKDAEKRLARFIVGYTPNLENIFTAANTNENSALLLDHEYCVDESGERTHAFGKSAGFATMAMSFMSWAQKVNGEKFELEKYAYETKEDFFFLLQDQMRRALETRAAPPKVLVLGSERGRSAQGCFEFMDELNNYLKLKKPLGRDLWGRAETQQRQKADGLEGITDFDIVINCTFTARPCEPFITDEKVKDCGYRPIILGDVTCDSTLDKNRFRVSNYRITDFDDPEFEAAQSGSNVYLITIDHSPSFFPREATVDMSNQFFPHLVKLLNVKRDGETIEATLPWGRALRAFNDNMRTPVAAFEIGRNASFSALGFDQVAMDEHLENNSKTLRDSIIAYMKLNPSLRPKEQRAFMFYVALGMTAATSGLKSEKECGVADLSDVESTVEKLRDTLDKKISISALMQEASPDIRYEICTYDENPQAVMDYAQGRYEAFVKRWPDTIYKPDQLLEKDKKPGNVFFIAYDFNNTDEAGKPAIIGGAMIYSKPAGEDKDLSLFGYFSDESRYPPEMRKEERLHYLFPEGFLGSDQDPSYQDTSIAEFGGAYRLSKVNGVSYAGAQVYKTLGDMRFHYAAEHGVEIVISELTAMNQVGFLNAMKNNSDGWSGYDFPVLQDHLKYEGQSFNDGKKRVVAMVSDGFSARHGLAEAIQAMQAAEDGGQRVVRAVEDIPELIDLRRPITPYKGGSREPPLLGPKL